MLTPLALTPESPLARTLYEVWSGRPVTVVKAAPGSGKSTLITRLVSLLLMRTDLSVAILTPTRGAAFDLAERVGEALADNCGPREKFTCIFGVSRPTEFNLLHSVPSGTQSGNARSVMVRTVASASGVTNPVDVDVVIVDEAYQTTLSDMAVALRLANQVVLVGDPGQIGPVVTVDDSVWAKHSTSPTRRAPEMLAERADAVVVELDTTYRLGPVSTELLNRLYDFPIQCGRSPRHVAFDPALDRPDVRTPVGGLPEVARLLVPNVVGRISGRSAVVSGGAGGWASSRLKRCRADWPSWSRTVSSIADVSGLSSASGCACHFATVRTPTPRCPANASCDIRTAPCRVHAARPVQTGMTTSGQDG